MLIYISAVFRGVGKTMPRIFTRGAAFALLMGAALVAQGAGLGKLTVTSSLGHPPSAEIDLVSLEPGESDSLSARVASPEAFRDARIEYGSSLRLLRFSVGKRANGQPYLKVSSVGPINEPFLDVLIEVSWPAGRIQREYPILLDPPGYAQGKVAPPAVTGAATAPRSAETPPAATPAAAPATSAAPAQSTPSSIAPSGSPSAQAEMPSSTTTAAPGSDTYGPVQKGETLRKIADQVKPSNVSMEQMLVALFRENKSAFIGSNMNRMKTGQILKVPTADEVSQVAQLDANKQYRTQVADWKTYRDQLAGGVASLPARAETSNVATGRVASAAITPPAPPAGEGKDVLKLSKSDTGKGGSAKGGGQDRVNGLQEEVIAKDNALKESQSRVADLEKQIRDMQRLVDLQKGMAGEPGGTKGATAPGAPPEAAPPKAQAARADAPKVEPPKVEPPKAEAPKPEPPKVAEAKPTEAAK